MRIAVINYACGREFESPELLPKELRVLGGWASSLHDAGCTVAVFQGYSEDASFDLDGASYHLCAGPFVPDLSRWRIPRRLHSRVSRWSPDVVHFNSLTYPLQLLHLRTCLHRTCAIVAQHHGEQPMDGWRRRIQRLSVSCSDAVLFNGLELGRRWREVRVIPRSEPVWAVPECSSTFTPRDQVGSREVTGTSGDPMLLWVGNLDKNKDPHVVLDAISRLATVMPGIHLWMAYRNAPLLGEVENRLSNDPVLSKHVTMLGEQSYESIGRLMAAADLLVQASWREGSGLAVFDALACGLPPVVTDIPSFRYLTDGGRVGALFRCGDADHLASSLLSVVEAGNPDRGELALRWFHKKLAWPAIARRAKAAYRLARCRRSATIQRKAT